ncbi:hypothetical protein GCM10028796_50590 [Ramlibacter monticola]
MHRARTLAGLSLRDPFPGDWGIWVIAPTAFPTFPHFAKPGELERHEKEFIPRRPVNCVYLDGRPYGADDDKVSYVPPISRCGGI